MWQLSQVSTLNDLHWLHTTCGLRIFNIVLYLSHAISFKAYTHCTWGSGSFSFVNFRIKENISSKIRETKYISSCNFKKQNMRFKNMLLFYFCGYNGVFRKSNGQNKVGTLYNHVLNDISKQNSYLVMMVSFHYLECVLISLHVVDYDPLL